MALLTQRRSADSRAKCCVGSFTALVAQCEEALVLSVRWLTGASGVYKTH